MLASHKANRVIHNAIFNVLGWSLPVVLNVLTTPYVVSKIGVEAFGVFTLILTILSYLSFLDLGLNLASVKYISECWAKEEHEKISEVVSSTLAIYILLGMAGSACIWFAVDWLIKVLRISPDIAEISRFAFRIGAIGFLTNMVSGTYNAIPNALQRFDITNKVTMTLSILSSLLTVGALAVGGDLRHIVAVRLIISISNALIFTIVAKRMIPDLSLFPRVTGSVLRELLTFGGISAVNKVAAQMIFQLNRFLIGALLGPDAVTYYAVPTDLTRKIHTLLSKIGGVLFPLFSEFNALGNKKLLHDTYIRAVKYITIIATAIYVPLALFAHHIMLLWMGKDFAEHSSIILSISALSFYILSFNVVAYHASNGIGKPGVNALSAVIGGVLNIALCLFLIPKLGILGAVIANLISMSRIPLYLVFINRYLLEVSNTLVFKKAYFRVMLTAFVISVGFAYLSRRDTTLLGLLWMSVAFAVAYIIGIMSVGAFDAEDRLLLRNYFNSIKSSLLGR